MLSGAAILAVFLLFAALMFARVVPALLALPAMAVCMALVAGVPWNGAGTIVVAGAASLASVYVTVIFGAMLGRVTLDTGIARSIVNFAAEFGGDRPLYEGAWRYESRSGHLADNLERYHMAAQQAIAWAHDMNVMIYEDYVPAKVFPPLDRVLRLRRSAASP